MTDMPEDPFAESSISDADLDPFANPDEVEAPKGPFVPRPGMQDIRDRLVVLAPKLFDKASKVSDYAKSEFGMGDNQELWVADLVVLDGALPLTFEYRGKVEGTKDEFESKTHEVTELPFFVPGYRITWKNVIGTLNKGWDKGLLYGRFRAGYTAAQMRGGKTFEDFAAEEAAFEKSPRGKTQPKARWHFVLSREVADKELALRWYRAAHADGFRTVTPEFKNMDFEYPES